MDTRVSIRAVLEVGGEDARIPVHMPDVTRGPTHEIVALISRVPIILTIEREDLLAAIYQSGYGQYANQKPEASHDD